MKNQMRAWHKIKHWWKYSKRQRESLKEREDDFRDKFTTEEGAENCFYHYHASGFPIGFPFHLDLYKFIDLSVKGNNYE